MYIPRVTSNIAWFERSKGSWVSTIFEIGKLQKSNYSMYDFIINDFNFLLMQTSFPFSYLNHLGEKERLERKSCAITVVAQVVSEMARSPAELCKIHEREDCYHAKRKQIRCTVWMGSNRNVDFFLVNLFSHNWLCKYNI